MHQLVQFSLNRAHHVQVSGKQLDGGSDPVTSNGRFCYATSAKNILDILPVVRTDGKCTPPYLDLLDWQKVAFFVLLLHCICYKKAKSFTIPIWKIQLTYLEYLRLYSCLLQERHASLRTRAEIISPLPIFHFFYSFSSQVSYFEIYLDKIRDLLDGEQASRDMKYHVGWRASQEIEQINGLGRMLTIVKIAGNLNKTYFLGFIGLSWTHFFFIPSDEDQSLSSWG